MTETSDKIQGHLWSQVMLDSLWVEGLAVLLYILLLLLFYTAPPPDVSAMIVNAPNILYSGLNVTLQCNVMLVGVTDTHVTLSVQWLKNGRFFTDCSPHKISDSNFQCDTELSYLSYKSDNGSYSCRVTSQSQSNFLSTQSATSNDVPLQVKGTQ